MATTNKRGETPEQVAARIAKAKATREANKKAGKVRKARGSSPAAHPASFSSRVNDAIKAIFVIGELAPLGTVTPEEVKAMKASVETQVKEVVERFHQTKKFEPLKFSV